MAKKQTAKKQTAASRPSLQASLKRCLSGAKPRNRQETFWFLRWQRLTRDHQNALRKRWNLPGQKLQNPVLARQAIRELM